MDIDIITFKSEPKQTFFAPEWEHSFYESFLQNIDLNEIKNIILKKEKEIKKEFDNNYVLQNHNELSVDGYTGLGENSLTSRYPFFNVFSWQDEEIQKLKNEVLSFYLNILEINNAPRIKTWIQCWANVMRSGEQIMPHIHSVRPNTYLGGHITIQSEGSSTIYINPINQINHPEEYESFNIPGKITIFPNYIPHYTTKYDNFKTERITIAFDIDVADSKNNHIIFDECYTK